MTSLATTATGQPPMRAVAGASDRIQAAWNVLEAVPDPEIPVVSLCDLGIVRAVEPLPDGDGLEVVLTPTYSGCPATEYIERSVVEALEAQGLGPVRIRMQRAPAWSTDWIRPEGRAKLRAYGIAPPGPSSCGGGEQPLRFVPRMRVDAVACPRCESTQTEQLSAFGATACKALYRCMSCREPFEYFKPI